MGQFEDMAMFVRIVEAGGIGKAAEQLNIAKSAVSRRLSELEQRLATQLLSRTTRKSTLTEAGQQYYQQAQNILEAVDRLNEQTRGEPERLEGTLKMTAPLSFGLMHLSQAVSAFACEHPDLNFQIDFSDRFIDLVEEGYELAIRIGQLQDSSYQARAITSIRHVICASPKYIQENGRPTRPEDLQKHSYLHYGMSSTSSLTLSTADGIQQKVELKARIHANNGDFLVSMALQGHGIVYMPSFLVYRELAEGTLIPLLSDYTLPEVKAYAVYPRNRFLSQRCRLLIDYITQQFGEPPYWDTQAPLTAEQE